MKKSLILGIIFLFFRVANAQIWTDITASTGLALYGNYTPTLIDYNNDGKMDFYSTISNGATSLGWHFFKNNGLNSFTDVTTTLGLSAIDSGNVITVDYNEDGNKDLIYYSWYPQIKSNDLRVYQNNSGVYTNVTMQVGIPSNYFLATDTLIGWPKTFDYNCDGDLDIVYAVRIGNVVYIKALDLQKNAGVYSFGVPVTLLNMTGVAVRTLTFEFFDMDNDGDFDVVLDCDLAGQYQNGIMKLFRKDLSGYTDISSSSGLPASQPSEISSIDINNDGKLDLVKGGSDCCTAVLYRVLLGNGNGVFTNSNSSYNIVGQGYKYQPTQIDFDNDGDFDFSWAGYTSTSTAPFRLWQNNGSNIYIENAASYGLNLGVTNGGVPITSYGNASWVDIDNDGDQDVILNKNSSTSPMLWVKQNPIGGNYLKVKLERCGNPALANGTRVMLKTGGVSKWLYSGVNGTDGNSLNRSDIFHFGLGGATSIDTLRVYWSSGQIIDYFPAINTTFTAGLNINCNVGVDELPSEYLFSVYPNPVQRDINLKVDVRLIGLPYKIIDKTGALVIEGILSSENMTIGINELSAGLYLIGLGENMKQSFKVIKE